MRKNRELRKLSREEVLELLLEQTRRADALQARADELEKALEDRRIRIERSGSIAEAALALNDVFLAAQQAADQYLQNIQEIAQESTEQVPRRRRRRRRIQAMGGMTNEE